MVDPKDLPLPDTPSVTSCQSSSRIVPTIEGVLSNPEGAALDKPSETTMMMADSPTLSVSVAPAAAAAVGGGGDGKDVTDEVPAAETMKTTEGPASIPHPVHGTLSRTHLAGMLSRKKKASQAGSGSGTPGFFKLFFLKGLGLKSSSSSSSAT